MKTLEKEEIMELSSKLTGKALDEYIRLYQRYGAELSGKERRGPPCGTPSFVRGPSNGLNIFSCGTTQEDAEYAHYCAEMQELKDSLYKMHRDLDCISLSGKTEEDRKKARIGKEQSDRTARCILWPGLPANYWKRATLIDKLRDFMRKR